MKIYIIIILFAFLTSFKVFSNPLFETDFYYINFSSNDVVSEKNKKITEVKKTSIKSIFNNILSKKYFKIVNRNLDEDQINVFIKSIEIQNEKIINNNYSADIKVNFKIQNIIKYLRSKKIPYVEYMPKSFLTIIYEDDELKKNLFTKENSYYKFLRQENLNFYKIPNLDINDRYLLSSVDIQNSNFDKINNFNNKYPFFDVVLIKSIKNLDMKEYSIYFVENNNLQLIKKFESNNNYKILFQNIKMEILDKWKINNSILNFDIQKIQCEIVFFNLMELKEIIKKIQGITFITRINLTSISYKSNNYDIFFYGNKNHLTNALKNNYLYMKKANDNCIIKLK